MAFKKKKNNVHIWRIGYASWRPITLTSLKPAWSHWSMAPINHTESTDDLRRVTTVCSGWIWIRRNLNCHWSLVCANFWLDLKTRKQSKFLKKNWDEAASETWFLQLWAAWASTAGSVFYTGGHQHQVLNISYPLRLFRHMSSLGSSCSFFGPVKI